MFLIIDTGTTNTRVNLLDSDNNLVARSIRTAGVRNTVADGNNQKIKMAIVECFNEVLKKSGAKASDVKYAIAAGMISSEIGLIDVPHVMPPAGCDKLAEDIYIVRNKNIFPLEMPIAFVRGIKNIPDGFKLEDLSRSGVMRGEEVQCIGAMKKTGLKGPLNIMIFSTCTKFVNINENSEIVMGLTSSSGSYYNMASSGSGGNFGVSKNGFVLDDDFYRICDLAYKNVLSSGFLQASAPLRMMAVFTETTPVQRDLYLNAAIAFDDCRMLTLAKEFNYDLSAPFIIIGQRNRCQVYEYMLNKILPNNSGITSIDNMDDVYDVTIQGILDIISDIDLKKILNN